MSSQADTTASERTALLRTGSGSQADRGLSPNSGRRQGPRESDHATDDGTNGATNGATDDANQTVSPRRAVAIILSVYILIFLQASNMSGMSMAQSTIAADLDAYEYAMWFTSAYLMALSSLSPLAGRLAGVFSARVMVLVSSVFFAAGGAITAAATSFSTFILGRVVSGVGGAGIMVLAFILVLELTNKKQRGLFVGLVNAGFTTGVSLGAVVYGGLIPVTGWRALFWAQVPCGVVSGFGVYFSIPKSFTSGQGASDVPVSAKVKQIDYLGAAMLTSTIVSFLYGLSGSTIQWAPIVASAGLLAAFLLVEYRVATDPIVPLAVLQNRGVLLSCLSQLGLMSARWTVLFYAPITALAVLGFAPAAAGAMLVPTNVGFGLGGLLVGWLHVRRAGSFWAACLASMALFAVTMAVLSLASVPATHTALYVAIVFVNGCATGAALNYTLAHTLHLAPPATHYVATSLLGTFRGFAGSFGSAIGGGVFARTLRASLERGFRAVDGSGDGGLSLGRRQLVTRLIGSPALVFGGGLGRAEHQVAVQGYADALRVLFQSAFALTLVVLVVQAWAGRRGPLDGKRDDDVEAIQEALAEHDGEFEA